MTYAQSKNRETCAGPRCIEIAEVEVDHIVDHDDPKIVTVGYCMRCALSAQKAKVS